MVIAVDAATDGFDGTYTNSPTLGVAGLIPGDPNKACRFNKATDDYVVSINQVPTIDWTSSGVAACAIIKPTTALDADTPIFYSVVDVAGQGGFWFTQNADGTVSFTVAGGPGSNATATSATVMSNGGTYRVIGTYNATDVKLYIDGSLEDTQAYTGPVAIASDQNIYVATAGALVGLNLGFDGVLDECAFYNNGLTTFAVAAVDAVLSGASVGQSLLDVSAPFAYYRLSEVDPGALVPLLDLTPTIYSPSADLAGAAGEVHVPLLSEPTTLYAPGVGTPTTPTGDESAPVFGMRIVDFAGVLKKDLPLAEPDTVTWTLNQPDAAEFHFPKGAYASTDFGVIRGAREAQIYRNGDLLTWGPIIGLTGSGGDGAVKCQVAGCEWYLNRRFLDAPIVNHLLNPDFESSTSNWTAVGSPTFTVGTDTFKVGSHSAKLANVTVGSDKYISQSHTFAPNGVGIEVTVSGWFLIDQFTDVAFETRGLYIEGIEAGVFKANNYYVIDNATPRGKWVKASCTLNVPPNKTWTINVRCYAIVGTVHWDDIKLVAPESIGSTGITGSVITPADTSQIIRSILVLMQNSSEGKSDLKIGMHSETTGKTMVKAYQFVDHIQFDQAMREFIERDDGIDYSLDLTPTTRTFHQYAGKRGTSRTGSVTLRYDPAAPTTSNCVDYRYTADAGSLITRQTVIGDDNGPDREYGESVDTSNVGGIVLQDVRQAPQNSEVASLQPLADERIARYSVVPQTIEMDLVGSSGLIGTIHCGDEVHVVVKDGYLNVDGNRRIMQMKLNCVTNILTVTVAQDTL